MDDYELDRIASDNPALTTPAAQRAIIRRQRSHGVTRASATHNAATAEELTKYDVCVQQTALQAARKLTKHRSAGAGSLGTSRRHGSR